MVGKRFQVVINQSGVNSVIHSSLEHWVSRKFHSIMQNMFYATMITDLIDTINSFRRVIDRINSFRRVRRARKLINLRV